MTDSISLFALASRKMEWLGVRQKVVAENVANADTPGFKAKDIDSFETMLGRARRADGLELTNARHISGTQGSSVGINVDETAWDETMDGNTVVLEQQTILSNDIHENFRLATQIYRKGHDLMNLAASAR